jgi:hypothetical protein
MALGPGASPDLVKRFRAKAVSATALQHPHIVAIHEVGIHEGRHFFAAWAILVGPGEAVEPQRLRCAHPRQNRCMTHFSDLFFELY